MSFARCIWNGQINVATAFRERPTHSSLSPSTLPQPKHHREMVTEAIEVEDTGLFPEADGYAVLPRLDHLWFLEEISMVSPELNPMRRPTNPYSLLSFSFI